MVEASRESRPYTEFRRALDSASTSAARPSASTRERRGEASLPFMSEEAGSRFVCEDCVPPYRAFDEGSTATAFIDTCGEGAPPAKSASDVCVPAGRATIGPWHTRAARVDVAAALGRLAFVKVFSGTSTTTLPTSTTMARTAKAARSARGCLCVSVIASPRFESASGPRRERTR